MVLARYKRVPDIKSTGCFGLNPLVALTSDESHYSIQKSAHWLGIGMNNLLIVKTNPDGCMCVDDLVKNIENAINSNRQPFFVNATAGTTVLGAFDDLNAIADVCEKYNLWMHVDVSAHKFFEIKFTSLITVTTNLNIFLELSGWKRNFLKKTQTYFKWNSSCRFNILESPQISWRSTAVFDVSGKKERNFA